MARFLRFLPLAATLLLLLLPAAHAQGGDLGGARAGGGAALLSGHQARDMGSRAHPGDRGGIANGLHRPRQGRTQRKT